MSSCIEWIASEIQIFLIFLGAHLKFKIMTRDLTSMMVRKLLPIRDESSVTGEKL